MDCVQKFTLKIFASLYHKKTQNFYNYSFTCCLVGAWNFFRYSKGNDRVYLRIHCWDLWSLLAFTMTSCSSYSSTLKVEATYPSETLVDFQQSTWRYTPEKRTFHPLPCENLKSYMDLCGSEQGAFADTWEHCKETSCFVKWLGGTSWRADHQILKENVALRNQSVIWVRIPPWSRKKSQSTVQWPGHYILTLCCVDRQLNKVAWPFWQWHERLTGRLSFALFVVTHDRSYIMLNLTDNSRSIWWTRQIACMTEQEMNNFWLRNINGTIYLLD
jgi:hypothetical protein